MGMVRGNRRKILNGIFSFESGFIFKDGGRFASERANRSLRSRENQRGWKDSFKKFSGRNFNEATT
jgi:hypothetical protein